MLSIFGSSLQPNGRTNRRQILQAGGAGLLGLTLPKLLAAEEARGSAPLSGARAKSVIFMFLFGGPSQLETFDLKPEAPAEIRGPFKPIASKTPGLLIGEHLPRCAAVSDKYAVVRTMSHDFNDHSGGGHYIQTGHRWHVPIGGGFNVTPKDWPSMGSVVKYFSQQAPGGALSDTPTYVVLPNSLGRLQNYSVQLKRPGETAGWLGAAYNPLTTRIDKRDAKDNPYWRACTDEELTYRIAGTGLQDGITLDRVGQRQSLLEQFNRQLVNLDENRTLNSYDKFRERAFSLVASERSRQAFDITKEPASVRDRYGRNLFGQSTLMARRLVEAGVRFVTVHYDCVDGYSWDSHRNSDDVKKHLLPSLDSALATLLEDLEQKGMLDETLVVCVGEMGRTPKGNKSWGRNHWSQLFPAVIAGAGVRGGVVHGQTDKHASYATSEPTRPEDLAATIYHALGIDHHSRIPNAENRPHPLVENGRVLTEIFG